jgi:hypothetical protein
MSRAKHIYTLVTKAILIHKVTDIRLVELLLKIKYQRYQNVTQIGEKLMWYKGKACVFV